MSRFQVRRSGGDELVPMYRVWDAVNRVFVETFSREVLAEMAVARLEREHRARVRRALDGVE